MAKEIDIAYSTFNLKINGNAYFTQDEIYRISNCLEIPKEKIYEYFFTTEVQKAKRERCKMKENETNKLQAENWELKQIVKEEKEKPNRFQIFVLGFSTATLIAELIQLFR